MARPRIKGNQPVSVRAEPHEPGIVLRDRNHRGFRAQSHSPGSATAGGAIDSIQTLVIANPQVITRVLVNRIHEVGAEAARITNFVFERLEHPRAASEDVRTFGMKSSPDVAFAILE